jgi:hypothetical protein
MNVERAGDEINVVLLRAAGRTFVMLPDKLAVVPASEAENAVESIDLAEYLGISSARSENRMEIEVKSSVGHVKFRAPGSVRIESLAKDAFYRLPMLLGEERCAGWVRGLVLLESEELCVWIDLALLAELDFAKK